MLAQLGLNLVC